MLDPVVFNTSKICSLKGIKHAVLSPGSRNAPLTISFARNPDIEIFNIVDERSAAFIALGIAQEQKKPVALCCTSGTALLNYCPAIAEAFYQEIPLIIFSADRPPELLNQRDGQTIDQLGALSNFVKETYQMPILEGDSLLEVEYQHKINEAINLALQHPKGPVHINVPFREPFYPLPNQELSFTDPIIVTSEIETKTPDLQPFIEKWHSAKKRLIVVGQQHKDKELDVLLTGLKGQAVIIKDIISNVGSSAGITQQDLFLAGIDQDLGESLQPDLLITFGRSIISKNLKLFLRKFKALDHFHFDPAEIHADTFQSISDLIPTTPHSFLKAIKGDQGDHFDEQISKNYIQVWRLEEERSQRILNEQLKKSDFCEFVAFAETMSQIPTDSDIHLANSMPVRFANFLQKHHNDSEVFCNRGTSGIDGTNGTAVGHALVSKRAVTLLTGDLSFFYDRNAFFHEYDLSNLKIIVFNNQGGGIFRLIPGPSGLPELEQHFETRHQHSAQYMAVEFGFDYYRVEDSDTLNEALEKVFGNNKTPQLIEVFTDPKTNQRVYAEIKKSIADR